MVPVRALGCMRLSTEPDRDDARGLAVLAAALDRTLCVGRGPADKGFARRSRIRYHDLATGWPTPDKLDG